MSQYFLRRLLLTLPTFLGITILVFTITRFVPGGPIERMITAMQQAESKSGRARTSASNPLSEDQMNQLREYYGFNKPILTSYGDWLAKVLHGDLGNSTRYNEPVWDIILQKLPVSTFYGLVTMLLTYLVCIPLGIVKAIKHKTWLDNITSVFVFTGYAVPSLVVAILLLVLFSSKWELFPMGGFVSDNFASLSFFEKTRDLISHSVLPLIAYMVSSFAVLTLLMKNSLMDNLATDYIRTAMSKGVPFRRAVFQHAFRNSLIPIATTFGNNISLFLTGSFLIERVFNIDGFGLLGYESVVDRDYPVVMGVLVLSSLLQLVGNILSDLCVAWVDPRVQFS